MLAPFSLHQYSPEIVDMMWAPALQQAEYAQLKAEFYERQLKEGKPVTVADLERMKVLLFESRAEQQPFMDEWQRRGGWSRAYTDQDGKVHREYDCAAKSCHDCSPQLLPAVSGWSDEQIVSHVRLDVCLDCFPKAKQNMAWKSAKSAQARKDRCPGSTRKPAEDGLCPVCSAKTELTKAGRVRAHKPQS